MKASGSPALRRLCCLAIAVAIAPLPARAHLVTTGLGPFYDGLTHFLVSLEDVLPALAIALLAGLQGARAGRLALFALPLAWLVAGLAAMLHPVALTSTALATLALFGIGVLAALDRRVPDRVIATLAILLGTVGGYLSASSIAIETRVSGLAVIGATTALFTIVALVAALAVAATRTPMRIAARVAASWLAAIGLLRLGWWLSSGG